MRSVFVHAMARADPKRKILNALHAVLTSSVAVRLPVCLESPKGPEAKTFGNWAVKRALACQAAPFQGSRVHKTPGQQRKTCRSANCVTPVLLCAPLSASTSFMQWCSPVFH